MVYLTMTTAIVRALEELQASDSTNGQLDQHRSKASDRDVQNYKEDDTESAIGKDEAFKAPVKATEGSTSNSNEPSLESPKVGNAISHGQIIDLSRSFQSKGITPKSLDTLLKGARVYIPPPAPKAEPSSEYKALMARLRREEEARTYERMTNPPPPMETFAQRFPMSSSAHAFPSSNADPFAKSEADEITYADVDRQLALVFNVLVSIIACAGGIWVTAKWWSTPARLALSFGGSLLVGAAEVVVYWGYVRRVGESKGKEKGKREVKEVVKTWVLGGEEKAGVAIGKAGSKMDSRDARPRKRVVKPS